VLGCGYLVSIGEEFLDELGLTGDYAVGCFALLVPGDGEE
jgi:hypothetical protein